MSFKNPALRSAEFDLKLYFIEKTNESLIGLSRGSVRRVLSQFAEDNPEDNFYNDFNLPQYQFWKYFKRLRNKYPELIYAILTGNFIKLWEVKDYFYAGQVAVCCGGRGTGKTNFSFLLGEILYGWKLITNVKSAKGNKIIFCNSTSQLFPLLLEIPQPKLVMFDEAGKIFSAYRSVFDVFFQKFLDEQDLIRKSETAMLFVYPEFEKLTKPFKRSCRVVFQKVSKRTCAVYGLDNPVPSIIKNIPPCLTEHNTLERADWID